MKSVNLSQLQTFVIMPSGNNNEYQGGNEESEYIYSEIIYPAVKLALSGESSDTDSNANITREVDRNQAGSINTTLVKSLASSDIVIVDITGRNPNVFLELGIRYALKNKITVIMAQRGTAIPFDIKGYRYIEYSRFRPNETRNKIAAFIREGLKEGLQSDSVVFDVFRNMSVIIPGIAESYGHDASRISETMQWDEYMEKINWTCQLLKEASREGHFTPNAVIGISNGGLIVADLIGREIFRGTPILGLWANRFLPDSRRRERSPYRFFDNAYNNVLINTLKDNIDKDEPPTILLLDDHLGTGNTSNQAIGYLKEYLGGQTRILFVPLVSRRPEYIANVESYLPYNFLSQQGELVFKISKEDFMEHLNTRASFFPYLRKEIAIGA